MFIQAARVFVIALVLCLCGFSVPAPAPALQITSASFSPIFGLVIAGGFTAGPDFSGSIRFEDNPFNTFPGCFPSCAPGDVIQGGGAAGSGGDLQGSISFNGQFIPACLPGGGNPPLGSQNCFSAGGAVSFGPAILPPFTGDPHPLVTGNFSFGIRVSSFLHDVPGSELLCCGGAFGIGTTIYDVAWQPGSGTWLLTHTEGVIPEVPEPSSLVLLGSTGALIGFARARGRRRHCEEVR